MAGLAVLCLSLVDARAGDRDEDDDDGHRRMSRVAACSDGRDNDSDGAVDYPQDPGCRSPRDRQERTRRVGCCEVRRERFPDLCLDRERRRSCRAREESSFHADRTCEAVRCEAPPTTLVVGLDGADWRVLEPLMDAGFLPAMRGLIEAGTRAAFHCRPAKRRFACFCPPVWTSIVTGTRAASHGIHTLPSASGSGSLSYERNDPALWTRLAAEGLTTTVVSYRGAWPPEEDQTFNLSEMGLDYAAFVNFAPGGPQGPLAFDPEDPLFAPELRTRPSDLFERLDLLPFSAARIPTYPMMARDRVAMESLARLVADRRYGRTHLTLLILHSPDNSEHAAWDTVQELPAAPIDEATLLEQAAQWTGPVVGHGENWGSVASQYLEIDRWLGAFLEAHPYDYVMFVSDHGMERVTGGFGNLPGNHRRPLAHEKALQGIYALSGPGVRRGWEIGERLAGELQAAASVLDVAPTLLYLQGLAVPSELPGRVTTELFTDEHLAAHPVRYR